jgi:hypothetical protein
MSYSKFLDDLNDFYKDRHERGILESPSLEEAEFAVRDKWLKDGRIKELVSFTLENWDSGNCDDFIKPLVEALITNNDFNLFKRLWKGILSHRARKAWLYFSTLEKSFPKLKGEDLNKIDVSNFNQFSSKEDLRRTAAFRRQFALNGISEFICGLELLKQADEVERAREFYQTIYLMQKPVPKPSTDKRKIDERVFWELIAESRNGIEEQYEFLDKLGVILKAFKPNEIRKFQRLLLTKQQELNRWEHWALAYIVRRGCGDDEFDYFRLWAISKGQIPFEAIKQLKTAKLKHIFDEDPQLEELLYLAETEYENKTGEIMKEVRVKRLKLSGQEWTEENITTKFPVLCRIFDYPS